MAKTKIKCNRRARARAHDRGLKAFAAYLRACPSPIFRKVGLAGSVNRRPKSKDPKLSDYTHFVVTPSNRIASGWSFASDAKEALADMPAGTKFRVFTRRGLINLGVDPNNTKNWTTGTDLSGLRGRR